jgi:CheY-like chemotaxis protein
MITQLDSQWFGPSGTNVAIHEEIPMNAALTILAVDDNPSIRSSLHYIFAGPRYEVTDVKDGDDALARLGANPDQYDVIIVDQKMPRLSGVELVQEIRKRGIAGKIMVLSAHLTPEVRNAFAQMDIQVIVEKPFDIHCLRSALDELAA